MPIGLLLCPLSNQRLQNRGYNQSARLAKYLYNKKTDNHLLWRVNSHTPQTKLKRQDRIRNLTGKFMINPFRKHELVDTHCVLVDDVLTTRATLEQASQILKSAGVETITCIVFARAYLSS
ncbi:MAG: ComF family protein [Limnohabitans sp.]|nr:ComF family protein [Limnohabitans sp.]